MLEEIEVFQSPDADDAFMMFALATGLVGDQAFSLRIIPKDIQFLNQQAEQRSVDISALSVHAFAHVSQSYDILTSGASFAGNNYGPKIVAKRAIDPAAMSSLRVALPGAMTSANLCFRIYCRRAGIEPVILNVAFDSIQDAVISGEVDAGVLIHESQLTHERQGLLTLMDLGNWWWQEYQIPLPLGVIVINKRFPAAKRKKLASLIKKSIETAFEQKERAIDYARDFAKGISEELLHLYIEMYANEAALDMGPEGRDAIKVFLSEGRRLGLIEADYTLSFCPA